MPRSEKKMKTNQKIYIISSKKLYENAIYLFLVSVTTYLQYRHIIIAQVYMW